MLATQAGIAVDRAPGAEHAVVGVGKASNLLLVATVT